jgi:hypothetical protein
MKQQAKARQSPSAGLYQTFLCQRGSRAIFVLWTRADFEEQAASCGFLTE